MITFSGSHGSFIQLGFDNCVLLTYFPLILVPIGPDMSILNCFSLTSVV